MTSLQLVIRARGRVGTALRYLVPWTCDATCDDAITTRPIIQSFRDLSTY